MAFCVSAHGLCPVWKNFCGLVDLRRFQRFHHYHTPLQKTNQAIQELSVLLC